MGLMDKVKAQATQAAEKAQERAQQAASTAQSKYEAAQAKRKAEGQLRDLGAATYTEKTGRSTGIDPSEADRLVKEIQDYEDKYGSLTSS